MLRQKFCSRQTPVSLWCLGHSSLRLLKAVSVFNSRQGCIHAKSNAAGPRGGVHWKMNGKCCIFHWHMHTQFQRENISVNLLLCIREAWQLCIMPSYHFDLRWQYIGLSADQHHNWRILLPLIVVSDWLELPYLLVWQNCHDWHLKHKT